jgi:tRNA pseudouridine55 synthase
VTHGILLCDKPAGRSSHGVVAIARKAFGTRRVGHAGTLDPMATGLLVLALGEGLKVLRYLTLDDKRYLATLRLGTETDSLDAEGRVTASAPVPEHLSLEQVRLACARFRGQIAQQPPSISAIKQDGVALYKRVRRGEQVQTPERSVVVHSLEVVGLRASEIDLSIHCGKGFYVRSLARDLARTLGTVGHLTALRRTHSGLFDVADATSVADCLLQATTDGSLRPALIGRLLPIERALPAVPCWVLDGSGVEHVRQGRSIGLSHVTGGDAAQRAGELSAQPVEPVLLSDQHGRLIAVARCAQGVLRVVRGLHC